MKVHPEKSNQINTEIADMIIWHILNRLTQPHNAPWSGPSDREARSAAARFNLLPPDYLYVLQCNFDGLIYIKKPRGGLIIN
jgi:hypothetical protein